MPKDPQRTAALVTDVWCSLQVMSHLRQAGGFHLGGAHDLSVSVAGRQAGA